MPGAMELDEAPPRGTKRKGDEVQRSDQAPKRIKVEKRRRT